MPSVAFKRGDLRHTCPSGSDCPHESHKPAWSVVAPVIFGEQIDGPLLRRATPSDTDYDLEINGDFLRLEWKRPGAPQPAGQARMLRQLADLKGFAVAVIEGDPRTGNISRWVYHAPHDDQKFTARGTQAAGLREHLRGWLIEARGLSSHPRRRGPQQAKLVILRRPGTLTSYLTTSGWWLKRPRRERIKSACRAMATFERPRRLPIIPRFALPPETHPKAQGRLW